MPIRCYKTKLYQRGGSTIKKLHVVAVSIALIAGGIYLLRGEIWQATKKLITDDMFVAVDADNFDPGLAVGTSFPAIKALYQGEEISDVSSFIHDKGMVFIANRSVDW